MSPISSGAVRSGYHRSANLTVLCTFELQEALPQSLSPWPAAAEHCILIYVASSVRSPEERSQPTLRVRRKKDIFHFIVAFFFYSLSSLLWRREKPNVMVGVVLTFLFSIWQRCRLLMHPQGAPLVNPSTFSLKTQYEPASFWSRSCFSYLVNLDQNSEHPGLETTTIMNENAFMNCAM